MYFAASDEVMNPGCVVEEGLEEIQRLMVFSNGCMVIIIITHHYNHNIISPIDH